MPIFNFSFGTTVWVEPSAVVVLSAAAFVSVFALLPQPASKSAAESSAQTAFAVFFILFLPVPSIII